MNYAANTANGAAKNGSTERYGFTDFCKEYLESQESVWDSLNNYDEEE